MTTYIVYFSMHGSRCRPEFREARVFKCSFNNSLFFVYIGVAAQRVTWEQQFVTRSIIIMNESDLYYFVNLYEKLFFCTIYS